MNMPVVYVVTTFQRDVHTGAISKSEVGGHLIPDVRSIVFDNCEAAEEYRDACYDMHIDTLITPTVLVSSALRDA